MIRKILLACLCLGSFAYAKAQTVTVLDADTGDPLELATVASDDPKAFVTTNQQGQADLSSFRGSVRIQFRLIGYATRTLSYFELEGTNFVVSLQPAGISLNQVVVSATRWRQAKREVPAKVATISAREVQLQNPQTAADLLGSSGEVFIQKSQQGGGSPMIRGFSTNRLLYTVDGVRMNTAIFRSGNLQNVISLDPFAVERTEVLFGAGSVIYGSDAIGGVMSFQTLTPEFSRTEEVQVDGSFLARHATANNELSAHFDLNLGWEKWASVTSFSTNSYGDLRMGTFGPEEYLRPVYVQRINDTDVVVANPDPQVQVPTGYDQINLMQKMRFQPAEDWDIQYAFHYSTTTDYARYDRHIRFRDGLPRSGEWSYGPQVWMMNQFSIAHTGNTWLYDQLDLRLAYQVFEESRIDRDFNDNIRRTRTEEVTALSANLDLLKDLGDHTTLFYGLEGIVDDVVSTGTDEDILTGSVSTGPSRYPKADWQSYAAYLMLSHDLGDHITVQAGARYNQFLLNADFSNNLEFFPFPQQTATINNGAFTGSLGIVFTPDERWVISTQLSTGFRAPNVDDVGKVFDSEPGSVVVPNPNLQAEYAYNAEIGIAHIIGNWAKFDLTGFYTILDNALVRRDYVLNGLDSILYDGELSQVQAIQNAARASVYGLQGGVEIKLPGGFGMSSLINFQVGEEELDDGTVSPSRHAAPMFGMTRLSYRADRLELQVYSQYSAERSFEDMPEDERGKDFIYAMDEDGNPYSPSWYTLNVKILYSASDLIQLSAGVENITDQRYRPYSSGLVAPGRNVILAVRLRF